MLQLLLALGFLLACMFTCSTPSRAQDKKPAAGVWSLQECIQYANKNNISLQQSEIQIQTTNATLQQNKLARYAPTVNANVSQNFNWGRSIDPFTNAFVTQRVGSNNFSLSASVSLFNGFRTENTILQGLNTLEINRLDNEQVKQNLSLNIALSYLNVLQNQELLKTAQINLLSTQTQLDRTQKLFEAGAIAENEVINLKATIANNQLAITSAQNQVNIAKVNLQQFMNYPVEESFGIKNVEVENLSINDIAETTEQIYSLAEGSQPSVKSADKSILSREISIDLAKGAKYPTVNLSAVMFSGYSDATQKFESSIVTTERVIGFVNNDPTIPVVGRFQNSIPQALPYKFLPQISDNFRQQASIQINIPIYSAGQIRTQIGNATLAKRNAELQAKQVRNDLRQTIEQAYINAKNALQTYQARQEQVKSLANALDVNEKRYNAGASNVVDYNLAKNNLDNAKNDLVRAKYDYLFRKKVLDFYMNKPLTID